MTTTKRGQEMQTFSFYGTDRFNLAGVHPHERCSESEEFPVEVEETFDDDGELLDSHEIGAEAQYKAVTARARQLLEIWTDQDGIKVVDQDGEEFFVYRESEVS